MLHKTRKMTAKNWEEMFHTHLIKGEEFANADSSNRQVTHSLIQKQYFVLEKLGQWS